MKRLRRKLGEDDGSPKYIFAEPRVGYRMPKGEEQRGTFSARGPRRRIRASPVPHFISGY